MITTNSVNFLRRKRRRVEQYKLLDTRVLQVAGVFCGISVALTVGLLAYWRYLTVQLREVKDASAAQERVITRAAKEEAEYLLFTAQLDEIETILSTRQSKKEALDFLARLGTEGVSFDRITFSALSRTLQFRVETVSVFPVETFLERLREETTKLGVLDVNMSGIKRDDAGHYYLDLSIILPAPEGANVKKK